MKVKTYHKILMKWHGADTLYYLDSSAKATWLPFLSSLCTTLSLWFTLGYMLTSCYVSSVLSSLLGILFFHHIISLIDLLISTLNTLFLLMLSWTLIFLYYSSLSFSSTLREYQATSSIIEDGTILTNLLSHSLYQWLVIGPSS